MERGYSVLLSEWHPIERYGIRHSWRRLRRYPTEISEHAWGNFIALDTDPGDDAIGRAASGAVAPAVATKSRLSQAITRIGRLLRQ